MRVIPGMHAEGQFALSGILRTHRDGWHHHGHDPIFLARHPRCIHGNVVRQNAVGQVGQMQVVGFGGPPRQQYHLIAVATHNAIVGSRQVYFRYIHIINSFLLSFYEFPQQRYQYFLLGIFYYNIQKCQDVICI